MRYCMLEELVARSDALYFERLGQFLGRRFSGRSACAYDFYRHYFNISRAANLTALRDVAQLAIALRTRQIFIVSTVHGF